jgi:hypothetical protein
VVVKTRNLSLSNCGPSAVVRRLRFLALFLSYCLKKHQSSLLLSHAIPFLVYPKRFLPVLACNFIGIIHPVNLKIQFLL